MPKYQCRMDALADKIIELGRTGERIVYVRVARADPDLAEITTAHVVQVETR